MHDLLVISHWPADAEPSPCRGYGGRYVDSAPSLNRTKRVLREKGWSYRTAAPVLGISYQHLAMVLTGRRESRRLLAAIASLPKRDDSARR